MITVPQLFMSRFCSSWERAGTTALMNTLRLRPVFLPTTIAETVRRCFPIGQPGVPPSELLLSTPALSPDLIERLRAHKILVDSPTYDDSVLARLRATIQPPRIRIAYFLLTDACNLMCHYCFIRKGMPEGYQTCHMTRDTARSAVELFARLSGGQDPGERSIIFYGGEPLMNPSVFHFVVDLVDQFKATDRLHPETRMTLLTNGTLLTDDVLEKVKSSGVSLAVSVDGYGLAHDASRPFRNGRSSYPTVLAALERCRLRGIPFSISPTISWDNINHFEDTMENIVSVIRPAGVGFNIIMGGTHNDADSLQYADAAAEFIVKAFRVLREQGIPEDRMLRKLKSFTDGRPHLFDCAAAGGNQIVVSADGQVGICHAFVGTRQFFVTDVSDLSFNPSSSNVFAEWNRRSPVNMEQCLSCPGVGLCGGGCLHNAVATKGSIWQTDERFCRHTLTTLEYLIWELHSLSLSRISRGAVPPEEERNATL